MTRRSWRGEDAVLDLGNPRLHRARIDDAPGGIQAIGAKRGGAPVNGQHDVGRVTNATIVTA